jgi:guanylate kinase
VLGRVVDEMDGIRFSISHTTRPARAGETEGVEYHFVDDSTFDRLVREGQFLEWANVHGHRYGTCRSEYERAEREQRDLLLDLDVQGAAQLRERFSEAVTVFILPPSFPDLERRLRGRAQDDEAAIRRRLEVARAELSLFGQYDYVIVNDDLEACVQALKAVIRAARYRTARMEPLARRILDTFRPKEES